MSLDYVDSRIREALRLHQGNEGKAKRQVYGWLFEDHKFLLELSQPHLNGIVAYAVTRMKNRLLNERQEMDEAAAGLSPTVDDGVSGEEALGHYMSEEEKTPDFGETMLRSFVSKNTAKFGYESSAAPIRRKAASQNHIDVMHMLAAASKKKSDE